VTTDTADSERQPPNDLEAEQAVLGAMMLSTSVIDRVLATVEPGEFYRLAHATIFMAIPSSTADPATPKIDPITVAAELTQTGDITRIGGSPYLHHLVNTVPVAANAEHYAEIVHDKATLRARHRSRRPRIQRAYGAQGDAAKSSTTPWPNSSPRRPASPRSK
jgi:replicative DNA helicase